ncbi:hypothetical protein IFM89_013108 [Coptis chinensis]|uniref:OTU domain-containing protein n=1 Tax=Coptis chinensis TaxID=261450 RepID=A0A835IM42_9MAGN|nr:hypothetical protein IFM89_013108 [Coptis chinensis]
MTMIGLVLHAVCWLIWCVHSDGIFHNAAGINRQLLLSYIMRNGTYSFGGCSSSTSLTNQQDIEDDRMIAVVLSEEYDKLDGSIGGRLSNLAPLPHVPRINTFIPNFSDASLDHQRLLQRLNVYGLYEVKVSGDGNCQFRALSDQMYKSPEHHKHVRKEIVKQPILSYGNRQYMKIQTCRESYSKAEEYYSDFSDEDEYYDQSDEEEFCQEGSYDQYMDSIYPEFDYDDYQWEYGERVKHFAHHLRQGYANQQICQARVHPHHPRPLPYYQDDSPHSPGQQYSPSQYHYLSPVARDLQQQGRQNTKALKDYRSLYESYVPMNYKRYYKKMAKSGEWGDHFGAKVCLLTSFRDTCFVEINPQGQTPQREENDFLLEFLIQRYCLELMLYLSEMKPSLISLRVLYFLHAELWLSFWSEVHYNSLYEMQDVQIQRPRRRHWLF